MTRFQPILLGSDINVYTLLGDGEVEEGECWEAFMFANHYKLDNLCIMVDVNGLQIDGADCGGLHCRDSV